MKERQIEIENFFRLLWCSEKAWEDKEAMLVPFTHKSYAAEHKERPLHNERQEFLGDAILGAVVASLIFERYPNLSEAELTLMKIYLVKEQTLAIFARSLQLWTYMLLSNGEEKTGGRDKDVILADALEALLWYIFLRCWWDTVENIIKTYIFPLLDSLTVLPTKSYKNLVQEYVQRHRKDLPVYDDREETYADGTSGFTTKLMVRTLCVWTGTWPNKRTAQELAAQDAYAKLQRWEITF